MPPADSNGAASAKLVCKIGGILCRRRLPDFEQSLPCASEWTHEAHLFVLMSHEIGFIVYPKKSNNRQ
jgi:hypothetical protein